MIKFIKSHHNQNLQAIRNFLLALILFIIPANSYAVIGIYNFKASMNGTQPPVHIEYRLNCAGTVTVEILDESDHIVCTLGPFQDNAGMNNHDWDGTGITNGTHTYRARIKANRAATGISGTLECLCSGSLVNRIYGVAIDKCANSPGYGTIYVSIVTSGGQIVAYYPDGSPKNVFGGSTKSNILNLQFPLKQNDSPWGIGVDAQGNIYAASKTGGIKVFDCNGIEIKSIPGYQTGVFWINGLSTEQGLEVYEAIGTIVRSSLVSQLSWNTIANFVTGMAPKQMCFESDGAAMYVATSSNAGLSNVGVHRYIRGADARWSEDTSFDCGLDDRKSQDQTHTAAEYAVGVSCDSQDPGGDGHYKSRSLWIALNSSNSSFGGNIFRKLLPNGQLEPFAGPGQPGRIIAADGVGNVAIESGGVNITIPWSNWGLYSPAGEASSDVRVTNAIGIAATAAPILVSSIDELDTIQNECLVEFQVGKTISAVFSDCFYIEELGRTRGIRIDGEVTADEGSLIRLRGLLVFEDGERKLKNVEILLP